MKKVTMLFAWLTLFMLCSCGKIYLPDSFETTSEETNANVTLKVSRFEQIPFENLRIPNMRTETSITELCTRLNFAVFKDDEKVKNISQNNEDEDFGTVTLSLANGTYKVVVIAHSCSGSATLSKPTEIKFPNNRLSDIFYYYGTISVTEEKKTYEINMKRAVAKFRLVLHDTSLPDEFAQMKFYYTGGSSTFDATTGHGCKASRQTEIISRKNAGTDKDGNPTFDVYTFPHVDGEEKLKMTITAQDEFGSSIAERAFTDIPVVRNQITQYSGSFFLNESGSSSDAIITADPEWDAQKDFVF